MDDVYALIDDTVPPWRPDHNTEITKDGAHITPYGVDCGPRTMTRGEGSRYSRFEFVMPFQRYIRAIDPAGNIMPLTVCSCRNEQDQLGEGGDPQFAERMIGIKRSQGWLIAEREYAHKEGKTAEEYGAFLAGEIKNRRGKWELFQADERKAYESKQDRAIEDRMRVMGEQHVAQNEDLATKVATAVATAMQGGGDGRVAQLEALVAAQTAQLAELKALMQQKARKGE